MKFILLICTFVFLTVDVFAQEVQKSEPKLFLSENLAEELLINMRKRYATKDTKTLFFRKKELEKQLQRTSLPNLTRQRLELEWTAIDERLTQSEN